MDSITATNRPIARPAAAPASEPAASDRTDMPGSVCPNLSSCQKLRAPLGTDPFTVSLILKSPRPMPAPGAFSHMSAQQLKPYEASPGQIADVQKFAAANGLKVASVDPQTRTVKLEGNPATMQKAFGVQLNQYKDPKGTQFRAYEGAVSLPKTLAGSVEGVLGLSNRPIAQPRNSGFKAKPADVPANGYLPTQVAQAYNFPKGMDGTGQTISIIELGGGYNQADMDAYFKKLGIPTPNINAISVDGATNADENDPNGADGEVALDIEVAGAVAPKATINVYFAPNSDQGFIDAVNQATKDNPKNNTQTISWGQSEDNWSADAIKSFNSALQASAAQGVNVYVASGDDGSTDGGSDGKNHVDFPSASPWDISAGGTRMDIDANNARTGEIAWGELDQQMGASGGGVSNNFPLPDFQQGAGVPAPTNPAGGRGVPDVAGDGAPDTGYDVIVDGAEGAIGGTSAVAPLYAGLTALLGQGAGGDIGYLNPVFYKNPSAFNDITAGSNGAFTAGPGWDAVTGLGSPDGTKLLAAIQAAKASKA